MNEIKLPKLHLRDRTTPDYEMHGRKAVVNPVIHFFHNVLKKAKSSELPR